MIDPKEMVFVVDKDNNPVSPLPRNIAHAEKLWHRTSGIWVVNHKAQVLTQKRSLKKDINPGLWEAFFGGHLAPNEEFFHNAVKELGEELGIEVIPENLIPYKKIVRSDKPHHKEFQQVFAYRLDRVDHNFPFEEDEVDKMEWKDLSEVKQILVIREDPSWVVKEWDKEVLSWLEEVIQK